MSLKLQPLAKVLWRMARCLSSFTFIYPQSKVITQIDVFLDKKQNLTSSKQDSIKN